MSRIGVRLGFCLRMTTTALLAFGLAQFLELPLHGLWMVLTAVAVTQVSVGASLRATAEYVVGTLGGAVYACAVGVLVHPATATGLAVALALAIAPLAYAAALSPRFRAAPFTAGMVLLVATQLHEGPLESALYRLLEVALGGAVAVAVALLMFPDRAHRVVPDKARHTLETMARGLSVLLARRASRTRGRADRPR